MENFIFCVVQFIQFWRCIFIWKFKQAYVRFLPIFVMLCILTHWNPTVLPFSTYIDDDDDDDDDDEDEFFLWYG